MSKVIIHSELPEKSEAKRVNQIFPDWLAKMQEPREMISTTIKALDNVLGGLHGFVILGGGPGSGKTGLAVQIAEEYGKKGGPVVFLSYEQGAAGFFSRIMQRELGISPKDQFKALQGEGEAAKGYAAQLGEVVGKLPNVLVYGLPENGEGENWEDVASTIEALQKETNQTCLVVVDSLHYVPLGNDFAGMDGKRAINKALSYLTEMQQRTGAAVLAIAHQTKEEVKGKSDGLMAFSGSATITYAADVGMIISRVEDSEGGPVLAGNGVLAKVSIPKNRLGEVRPKGIEIEYNLQRQTYSDHD